MFMKEMVSVTLCVSVFVSVLCARVLAESPCVMISEVNSDNPSLDTAEFVELYHSSGGQASLDGLTLVFYNGNGNSAYRVLNLTGHSTDQLGFFLVGSANLWPRPSIPLQPNTVQNGPDAIALYGPQWGGVVQGGNVSAVGLLDALVYSTRRMGGETGARFLASVLTPGSRPFVEDDQALEGDESIQRCWLARQHWTFHTSVPTPGQPNHCEPPSPARARINELRLGGPKTGGLVELWCGVAGLALSVVIYDGQTNLVSSSADLRPTLPGIVTVTMDTSSLAELHMGAVVVYEGKAADFPKDSLLSQQQPIDAFVFGGPAHSPSANLTEMLTPGRQAFLLQDGFSEGGVYLSRCGVADWTRDPGMFVSRTRSPGVANHCPWFVTCPHDVALPEGTVDATIPPLGNEDFLLNEVNADTPGSTEDEEYVEIWHPSGRHMSLDNIWLLLLNGQTGRPYREIALYGYYTDQNGYFLVGSDRLRPPPSVPLPPNTIQNGPDAVALYRSFEAPSRAEPGIPRQGLLDAVVYRVRGSDREAAELMEALTPGQLPLLEDAATLPGDESLSRCRTQPLDLSAFWIAPPTPMKQNACPRSTPVPPTEGVYINEVGGAFDGDPSQQSVFVELIGPAMTPLNGFVMVMFEAGANGAIPIKHTISLSGNIGEDGFYLLGNQKGADQVLPALGRVGAVMMCLKMCRLGPTVLHSLILTDDQTFHNITLLAAAQYIQPAHRSADAGLASISHCETKERGGWMTSYPTPRLPNVCPNLNFSIPVYHCLLPGPHDWQLQQETCFEEGVVNYLEQHCQCGFSAIHLHDVSTVCASGVVHLQGSVLAISEHQRELITKTLNNTSHCSSSMHNRLINTGSSVGLQIGLVLAAMLLLGLSVFLFVYLYRKRRPLDYHSMALSEL